MNPRGSNTYLFSRQERLRALMQERQLQFIVVSAQRNVLYLTGFRGSAGMAVFTQPEAALFVDPRYTLQAREQSQGVVVHESKGRLLAAAGQWLAKRKARNVGYDDANLTCAGFAELKRYLAPSALRASGGLVEELRLVKDPAETQCIRQAAQVTSAVFSEIIEKLRPGLREADLAAEIEYRMRRRGAERAAFETIVASGLRSAWPHARPSSKLLKKNELVILDLGAILCDYASDLSRTVFLGKPSVRVRNLFRAVLGAQQEAIESIRAGVPAWKVDSVARRALSRRALDGYFIHSTGHGVGLDIHEKPRLGRGERTLLPSGCVITVEPGVYIEGVGGIRIEDTVVVREDGSEVLTSACKEEWIIS